MRINSPIPAGDFLGSTRAAMDPVDQDLDLDMDLDMDMDMDMDLRVRSIC